MIINLNSDLLVTVLCLQLLGNAVGEGSTVWIGKETEHDMMDTNMETVDQ